MTAPRTLLRLLRRLLACGVALTALFALLPMLSAHAQGLVSRDRLVSRTGQCGSGNAQWDLKAKHASSPGRIYVEFEVDQIPRGAHWQLFVSQNGRRILAVDRTAKTRRGVQVSKVISNRAGRDRFRASGVNPASGTTCFGRLRF